MQPSPTVRAASWRRAAATAPLWLALAALGGCATGSVDTTGSTFVADYRDRHPIVIQDGNRVLDVFVEGPTGLTPRSRQDLGAYLAEYSRYGSGTILVQVPVGHGTNPGTRQALATIQQAANGRLSVTPYHPNDPTVASPIRLTFKRLQAKVGSQCGLWPDDLGTSDARVSWQNREYWNFGCATRSNFAAQVADPNDLVRGRQYTQPDTVRRMWNFEQLRKGEDPSTNWKQQDTTVRQSVAQ